MDIKNIFRTYKFLGLFIIAEIVLIALFLPHKKEMVDFKRIEAEYSKNQTTCRFDIYNYGKNSNKLVIKSLSNKDSVVSEPKWMLSDKGQGTMIQSTGESLDFTAELVGDGSFSLRIRGVDFKDRTDSKRRIPVCITLTKLVINEKEITTDDKVVWHDSPFEYKYTGKNGDELKVHAEWEPFIAE